jgi:hypothetical protein
MKLHSQHLLLALAASLMAGPAAAFQRGGPSPRPDGSPRGSQVDVLEARTAAGIAWFGRWDDAKEEAARTGRPILLMSAAPQCSGAPGIW